MRRMSGIEADSLGSHAYRFPSVSTINGFLVVCALELTAEQKYFLQYVVEFGFTNNMGPEKVRLKSLVCDKDE